MINALFGVCQILQFRGELEAVRKKLLQIIQISKEIGSLASQSSAHQMLAKIYKQWERYQPALEHYELFHAIHVQMFNEQSERRLQNARVLLEVETLRKQANLYRSLAATDALTGLLSRREFLELGEKALTNYRRLPVSLLMIDVDHFKSINDQRGHSVGDQVLAMVARRLKSALRQDDLAGRYGGDEFVILMPETSLPACQKVAERCCKVITEEPFQIDALILQMSISVGLATLETDRVLRLEALIQRADEALLLAKQNGRNRVVTSGSV
jgi:diguanylate cyclase (GGDEF)-like protein